MNKDGMPSKKEIRKLQMEGHTFHCAMRILTGDGECECEKRLLIPGGISAKMYEGRCRICLGTQKTHKWWCLLNGKEGT